MDECRVGGRECVQLCHSSGTFDVRNRHKEHMSQHHLLGVSTTFSSLIHYIQALPLFIDMEFIAAWILYIDMHLNEVWTCY